MKKLLNIKKSIIEIAQILAQNEDLAKLLINDSNDPLNETLDQSLDLNDLIQNNYICIVPPVESRIEDYGRNTFITILLDHVSLSATEDNSRGDFIVYVSTNEEHLLIKDNKNRLLEMSDIIIDLLDNTKLSSAGKISVKALSFVMLSEFHFAYRITLSVQDLQVRKAEI